MTLSASVFAGGRHERGGQLAESPVGDVGGEVTYLGPSDTQACLPSGPMVDGLLSIPEVGTCECEQRVPQSLWVSRLAS